MAKTTPDMAMLGTTTVGSGQEDLLRQLRGERWHRTVREMTEQDSVIAAILFAIEMMIRRVDWELSPASDDPEDGAVKNFVDTALFQDMDPGWEDTLAEILSFLPYGWAFFETVYKVRSGETRDPAKSSRYSDGRVGWRSWSIRPQETLYDWVYREDGTVEAMIQVAPPHYRPVTIPIDKALLFRTSSRHGAPEGRSILRSAYTAWYYRKNIERIEAIGIERDLAGLPVAWVPSEILSSTATPDQKKSLDAMKRIVTNIRRNEQEGVVMPQVYDQSGKPRYDLKLLSSGGQRQFDTDAVIQRYDTRIAMSVLADFLTVGHEQTGSYALISNKTELFVTALEAWLDAIAAVINEQAIRRLVQYNGIPPERAPRLGHGKVKAENLEALGTYLVNLAKAGVLNVTPELQDHVLSIAGMPAPKESGE